MLGKLKNAVTDDSELDASWIRLLSLVFLGVSGAMSFFEYTHIGWLWDTTLTFVPRFISTIIAVVFVAPLYLRRILVWNRSIYSILSFILILLVFASFIELATGGNDKNSIVLALLTASALLSWLGIRAVASIAWVLALGAAIYAALENNMAMGFYGFIYIGSGFLGLVLHSGLNPGELFKGLKNEYSPAALSATGAIKTDINSLR